jgi:hypothetical protein
MKRHFFLLGVAIFIVANAFAERPFNLGIKGGLTSSTFTIDKVNAIYLGEDHFSYTGSDFQKDASNGLGLGLFARINLGRMYIQPEGNFVVRNGKLDLNVQEVDVANPGEVDYISQEIKLSTLDIPVLVGVKLLDLKMLQLNLFTGPSASILLNENIQLNPQFTASQSGVEPRSVSINQSVDDFDIEDELRNANFNWQVGVGVDIGSFVLDVRYEYGISDMTKFDFVQKTNMLMFSVGFKIF